jgi:hypothetical protein
MVEEVEWKIILFMQATKPPQQSKTEQEKGGMKASKRHTLDSTSTEFTFNKFKIESKITICVLTQLKVRYAAAHTVAGAGRRHQEPPSTIKLPSSVIDHRSTIKSHYDATKHPTRRVVNHIPPSNHSRHSQLSLHSSHHPPISLHFLLLLGTIARSRSRRSLQ